MTFCHRSSGLYKFSEEVDSGAKNKVCVCCLYSMRWRMDRPLVAFLNIGLTIIENFYEILMLVCSLLGFSMILEFFAFSGPSEAF